MEEAKSVEDEKVQDCRNMIQQMRLFYGRRENKRDYFDRCMRSNGSFGHNVLATKVKTNCQGETRIENAENLNIENFVVIFIFTFVSSTLNTILSPCYSGIIYMGGYNI